MALVAILTLATCSSSSSSDLGADTTGTVETRSSSTAETSPEPTPPPEPSVSSTAATQLAEATTTSTTVLVQQPLPSSCSGIDTPLLPNQLTYVAEGKLIAVDLAGDTQCLIDLGDDAGIEIVEWSAQADRVMFNNGRVDVLGGIGRIGGEAGPDNLIFSWPTGFNMMWLLAGVIQKSTSDARQLRELDLGLPVLGVTYHPDGQHLFVVVDEPEFSGSQVLVTNSEGEGAAPLLFSDNAKISELVVAAEGSAVVFTAEHGDGAVHVHALDLEAAIVTVSVGDDDEVERVIDQTEEVFVMTVFEAVQPVTDIVFDPSGEQVAFAVGDCRSGSQIELIDLVAGGYPLPIDPLFSARPVGFLTETQLAIMVYDESCIGGDLYVADTITGEIELVRAEVDGAAVRRVQPPARFTLVDVAIAGFA